MMSPTYISTRADGLGERLRSLLNAMVAAERCNGNFLFHWPVRPGHSAQFHAILAADETFDAEFLEQHAVDNPSQPGAVVINQMPLDTQIPHLAGELAPSDFVRAFNAVRFQPNLEQARQAARSVDLEGEPVAIHLRAGDIIYGHFRHSDRFLGKAMPYPIAERLIALARAKGDAVLIFGQDRDLSSYLSDKYGAILADSIGDELGFDDAQKALFEICLMSRCSAIFAGSSGFAYAASQLSGTPISGAGDVLSREEQAESIALAVADTQDPLISDLQVAYACLYGSALFRAELSEEARNRLTEMAIRKDPENPILVFQRAHFLYDIDDCASAERILLKEMKKPPTPGLWRLFTDRYANGAVAATRYMAAIYKAAATGAPVASFCAALDRQNRGDMQGAETYFAVYKAAMGPPPSGMRKALRPELLQGYVALLLSWIMDVQEMLLTMSPIASFA